MTGHEHHGCNCGDGPQMITPDPTPLDELITIHNLSVDPETHQVSLITKRSKTKSSEEKLLQDALETVNAFAKYLSSTPFPHCPSAPTTAQKNPRSIRINSMKEESNAAIKAKDFNKAIEVYTRAAEEASKINLSEPSAWIREELSTILCERAAAYCSAKMWLEALCDAEAVIQLRKGWCQGYLRRAKALQGLGRIDDAKDATLMGLELEPGHPDLTKFWSELNK